VNVSAFRLTIRKLRALEETLRAEGLSHRDCRKAVAAVKRWLQRDAEVPENTPSDLVLPDDTSHP
jgi:hypothetical protein